jgi:hypothetical protein
MDIHNPGSGNDNPDLHNPAGTGEDLGLIQSTVTPDTLMTFNQWAEYIFNLLNKKP